MFVNGISQATSGTLANKLCRLNVAELQIGEPIYGENMVSLEQSGTKGFSTVFISIRFAEQHNKNRRKSNIQKYVLFFKFKV